MNLGMHCRQVVLLESTSVLADDTAARWSPVVSVGLYSLRISRLAARIHEGLNTRTVVGGGLAVAALVALTL